MPLVLRWGRSAYETDADLALERAAASELGLDWLSRPATEPPDELESAAVLVVNSGVRVDEAALDRFGGDLVLTTTSGVDHIDREAARERGVSVARSPMARRDAVVETTLAGLLGLFREIPRLHDASARGQWARKELPALAPVLLGESTVAVVGSAGVIGALVCRRLLGLGADVIGVDPDGGPDGVRILSLDDAIEEANALTLHCHLTPDTAGMIDADRLDLLGPGSVVVNTSRGPILDVDAAVDRVADGRLRGILVDVFAQEPWPGLARGAAVPGVRFTPHAAGYTPDLGQRVAREVAAALTAWHREDLIPNLV